MELADEALLKRSAKGDRQASALLINRHSSRVLSLAQRMLGSREDAEDVSQEVFLKVFQQAWDEVDEVVLICSTSGHWQSRHHSNK